MQGGYVKIWRKIKTHPFWQKGRVFSDFEAWLDMIMQANGTDKTVNFREVYITVKRGSFITSEVKLAESWRWSRNRARRFLNFCTKNGMIVNEKRHKRYTHISILKYDSYNPSGTTDDTTKGQQTIQEEDITKERERKIIKVNKDLYVNQWNDFAIEKRLPTISGITGGRLVHLKARIADGMKLSELVEKIKQQPFLLGDNKDGWTVTFDWAMNLTNYTKIMELNYAKVRPKTKSWAESRGEEKKKEAPY